ncbi:cytochrome c oxidase assembly factor Coa1 family protein [Aquimarina pacifica]|uniref:cytochrome c oxidase assembly factor Coa1 family protein n=1 Tax=Aquimarina pacifica TaxID=1296415 RepID=UPI000470DB55|nr:cytochrome c oxidase assembly factor Coa1 family protein [Aquimarina pacifica]
MNNEIIEEKSWWKRNWKWFFPLLSFILISIVLFFSSGMGGHMTHFAQAYVDTELYENAIKKAQLNKKVTNVLGELEPIDNLAILEGEVHYFNDNKSVDLSIRVKGSKRKASMDIAADRINGEWNYRKINIRIKKPIEEKQTIEIIKQSE